MNFRQKKKKIKKRWRLQKVPKGIDLIRFDRELQYMQWMLSKIIAEKLDVAILEGNLMDGTLRRTEAE